MLAREVVLISLLAILCASQATNIISFDQFIAKFKKTYQPGSEEYEQKKKIFQYNVDELKKKNCSVCGVTKFFDVAPAEFTKKILVLDQPEVKTSSVFPEEANGPAKLSAPRNLDWRKAQVITSVKAQGDCGCCWAFASAALAESSLIMKGQADLSIDLSEQYLLQCTSSSSCNGGYIQYGLKVVANKGLPDESKYPYNPFKPVSNICASTSNRKITSLSPRSYYSLSDDRIKDLLSLGPLAVAIDATDWQYYDSGIWKCTTSDVNHAVLLVGYTDNAWIVKNQWGDDWGEKGYIYISMGSKQNCAINTAVHMLYEPRHLVFAAVLAALVLLLA